MARMDLAVWLGGVFHPLLCTMCLKIRMLTSSRRGLGGPGHCTFSQDSSGPAGRCCEDNHSVSAKSTAQQCWRKEQPLLKAAHLSESGTEKNRCLGGGGLGGGACTEPHLAPACLPKLAGSFTLCSDCSAAHSVLYSSAGSASTHFNEFLWN